MLRLPLTAPLQLREALEAAPADPDGAIAVISQCLRGLFAAELCLTALEMGVDESTQSPLLMSWYGGPGPLKGDDARRLQAGWIGNRIHHAVKAELQAKLSPVSYSRFSWPYPHTMDGAQPSFPAEFSLFLPISCQLMVRLTSDREFFGYSALMFPSFPELSDELVQLIVVLPMLLSQVVQTVVRAEVAPPAW